MRVLSGLVIPLICHLIATMRGSYNTGAAANLNNGQHPPPKSQFPVYYPTQQSATGKASRTIRQYPGATKAEPNETDPRAPPPINPTHFGFPQGWSSRRNPPRGGTKASGTISTFPAARGLVHRRLRSREYFYLNSVSR